MNPVLIGAVVAVGVAAWLVAAISAICMIRYRKRSLLWLAVNGMAMFDRAHFRAGAEPHRRRLVWGTTIFFGAILTGIVIVIASIG